MKAFLNVDLLSITTTLHIPNVIITSDTKSLARESDSIDTVGDETTNCVISHMLFIR